MSVELLSDLCANSGAKLQILFGLTKGFCNFFIMKLKGRVIALVLFFLECDFDAEQAVEAYVFVAVVVLVFAVDDVVEAGKYGALFVEGISCSEVKVEVIR